MAQADTKSDLMDYFDAPHVVLMGVGNEEDHSLAEYLERQGINVSVAAAAEETEALIYETPPDLLILDVEVPDLKIFELCQQVKHDQYHLGYIPIVIMTSMKEETIRLAGMLSADEYMFKPVQGRDLMLRIQTLLWLKRQLDEKRDLADDLKAAKDIAIQVQMIQRHFIHNVNHEFRTPLLQMKSSIAMLSGLLNKMDEINPRAEKLVNMATQATARLENVFQNIAQFEVFDNVRNEPFILSDAIKAAVKHFQRSWAFQSYADRIETFLGADPPPVIGDRAAVQQILIKLVENAIKFSDDETSVEISVRVDQNTKEVWITVKDYGIGLDEEDHQLIFEPFVQLDSSSTRDHDGLGIGLTLAQILAKGMGRQIFVGSNHGEPGSHFKFSLPIADFKKQDK